ncbi:MSCRAMM family protein [Ruminococcus bromii]|uniref:MSCRAMM family protein n=1 Tax=Ruminococcus bromii TaxID=40518 RepID=UPI00241F34EE|nr:SpaA isopeptide-forming pilin-related protein [Ruminococcus bromii]
MRKFFKKLMAVGLSLVTLVSGMSISMGSAAAATQNTTSGQWVTTTVSKGNKITLPGIPASETCKFIINGDEGFCINANKWSPSGEGKYKYTYVDPKSSKYGMMRKAVYLYRHKDLKTTISNVMKKKGFAAPTANTTFIMMHYLLSYINEGGNENGLSSDPQHIKYNMQDYYYCIPAIYKEVKANKTALPSASNFLCYLVTPQNDDYQNLFMVAQNTLTIKKVDSVTLKGLPGATFSVTYTPDGKNSFGSKKSMGSYTTGSDGTVKVCLPPGNYVIKETKPPKNYSLNSASQTANFIKKGAITVTFKNDKLIKIQLQKTSANPELTKGNSCYSLAGTEYSIYTNKSCSKDSYFGFIRTDANGFGVYGDGLDSKGKHVGSDVANKTYYAKETKAPKGYKLDTTVYTFKDSGKKTVDGVSIYSFTCSDKPANDPVTVLLKKQDAKTGQATTRLAGAEFTIKYYDGTYKTEDELKGVKATRSWIIKTGEDGMSWLDKEHLVSGDEFYYSSSENKMPCLPLGTVTIQETKAPENYELNPNLYIGQITEEGGLGWLTTNLLTPEGQLIVPESETVRGGLSIHKSSDDAIIKDIWFRITSDNGYSKDVATNSMGTIELADLDIFNDNNEYVKYTIEELGFKDANGNYYIPKRYKTEGPKTVTLKKDGTVTVSFNNSIDTVPLNIIKSADDKNVSGIYFKVTASTGKTYTVVTDNEGKASVSGLPVYDTEDNVITYTVEELGIKKDDGTFEIPVRYVKPSSQTVKFVDGTSVIKTRTLTFKNNLKKGVAKIAKTSDDGVVQGIYFKIESDYNDYSAISSTGKTGIWSIYSLPVYNEVGEKIKYTVTELGFKQSDGTYKIPEYYFHDEPQTVELTENTTTTVNFKNLHKKGSLLILKSSSDKVVDGIYFEVKSLTDGFEYDEYVATNSKGMAQLENMEVCNADGEEILYEIRELGFKQADGTYKLPKRYVSKEPEQFSFNADNMKPGRKATYTYTLHNFIRTANLNVKKTSDDNIVNGITFNVKGSNGVDYGNKTVDSRGMSYYTKLPVYDDDDNLIKYTVTELGIKQDDGTYKIPYRYNEVKPQIVTLKYDTATETAMTKTALFNNTLKLGSVTINKVDNDGKAIEGAKFNLVSKETGEIFATVTTDKDGKGIISDVPQGDYSLEETQTIAGLNLLKEASDITISGDSEETLYYTFNVKETYAPVLPMTGGANAICVMFGLSAMCLIAGGAIFFIKNKKKKDKIKTEVES